MELTCKHCGSKFRAALQLPLVRPVRVACPSCGTQMVLKPVTNAGRALSPSVVPPPAGRAESPPYVVVGGGGGGGEAAKRATRIAAIADEPRPFRHFLAGQLRRLGFDVTCFETGDPTLDFVRRARADLVIVNVYLRGRLGVEVSEDIKSDASLSRTRVILIGALFRANRFRANPTNLYGADEYIEEQIPEKEFRQVIYKLFPETGQLEVPLEPREYDDARRLARLILSDIVIYHAGAVERGIRDNNFFEVLKDEIEEGRQYYESRVPMRVRRETEIFSETLQQFVSMKREEIERTRTGT